MKTLGAIAILAGLLTTGCDYHDRYRHREEIRRTRDDIRRAGQQAREEARRARQDVQRELRQAREQFRRDMREAHRDLRDELRRW